MKITENMIKELVKEELDNLLLERAVIYDGVHDHKTARELLQNIMAYIERGKKYKFEGSLHRFMGGEVTITIPGKHDRPPSPFEQGSEKELVDPDVEPL
jgi:hypothetical protein